MRDMYEGKEAFDRFDGLMKQVITVPHAEIKRRVDEERKKAALNPKRRGPKPKRKPAKASASRASGGTSKRV